MTDRNIAQHEHEANQSNKSILDWSSQPGVTILPLLCANIIHFDLHLYHNLQQLCTSCATYKAGSSTVWFNLSGELFQSVCHRELQRRSLIVLPEPRPILPICDTIRDAGVGCELAPGNVHDTPSTYRISGQDSIWYLSPSNTQVQNTTHQDNQFACLVAPVSC